MFFGLTRTAIPKQRGQAIDSARALFETVLRQNEAVGCLISLYRATRKNASPEKWDYCQLGIRGFSHDDKPTYQDLASHLNLSHTVHLL